MLICGRFSGNPEMVKASTNAPPMKLGAKGEGVRVLQMALIDLGMAMPRSTANGTALPDGIFGAETQAMVIAFQRGNALVADGIVGAQTVAQLDRLLAARSEVAARSAGLRGEKPKGLS